MEVDYGVVLGIVGILTGAVSLLYARSSAKGTHRQADGAERRRRETAALSVISTFQTQEFADLILKVDALNAVTTREEFDAQDRATNLTIVNVTQRMEMLGVMVADGLIDLALVEKTLGSFVILAWGKMKGIYTILRKESGDPTIAEYFQWLAECIEKRQQGHVPAYVALKDHLEPERHVERKVRVFVRK